MRRSDAFPSKYMGKDDIGSGLTLTIGQVVQEGVESDGDLKQKAVMYFEEHDAKPWIINAGNWMTIEDAYGEESDDWHGKQIELFVDPSVMFGGKRVGGVRVRIPRNGSAKPAARPAPAERQTGTVLIHETQKVGGWYIVTDFGGDKYGTQNQELGDQIMSWGKVSMAVVYETTTDGKRILVDATLSEQEEPAPW